MTTDGIAHDLIGGEVTMLASACVKCRGQRMARVEILRLTEDGVTPAGHTVVCISCDTRPAP